MSLPTSEGEYQQIVADLEEEFKDRFTEKDEEYKETLSKTIPPPPTIIPWTVRPKRNYDWSSNRGESSDNRRSNYYNRNRDNHYRDNPYRDYRGRYQSNSNYHSGYHHGQYRPHNPYRRN